MKGWREKAAGHDGKGCDRTKRCGWVAGRFGLCVNHAMACVSYLAAFSLLLHTHWPGRAPALAAGAPAGITCAPAVAGRDPQRASCVSNQAHPANPIPLWPMGVAVQRWQCQRAGWGCGTSCGISASGSSGDGGWLCTYGTPGGGDTKLNLQAPSPRVPHPRLDRRPTPHTHNTGRLAILLSSSDVLEHGAFPSRNYPPPPGIRSQNASRDSDSEI